MTNEAVHGASAGVAFDGPEGQTAASDIVDGRVGEIGARRSLTGVGGKIVAVQHHSGDRAADQAALSFVCTRAIAKDHHIGIVEFIHTIQPPAIRNGIHGVFGVTDSGCLRVTSDTAAVGVLIGKQRGD